MRAAIRAAIEAANNPAPPAPVDPAQPATATPAPLEQFYSPEEVAALLSVNKNTIKNLMKGEPGTARIGNARHIERYPASAVHRLIARLQHGDDPRYSAA